MTKEQFIQTIQVQTDKAFLLDIIKTALDTLPEAYAHNIIYELYATRVYDGPLYTVKHKETGQTFTFAGIADTHEFFKSINPRYSKENLFRVRNNKNRTLYGYYVIYTDKKKETD